MNMRLTCCVVISILVAVSAYNFDDPDYNQILAGDWEEWNEDSTVSHPRQRRDDDAVNSDKCRRKRPKYCCADETLEAMHESDKAIKKECYKEVTGKEKQFWGGYHFHGHHDPFKCDKEKAEKHRNEVLCVMQCVGQKKDVLDADGNIKEENAKKVIMEKLAKEEWFLPKIDSVFDACLAEAKKAPEKIARARRDAKTACNGQFMMLGHCLWKQLQLACPEDQIKDQKACDKVRERINNHPDFPFPPPKATADEDQR